MKTISSHSSSGPNKNRVCGAGQLSDWKDDLNQLRSELVSEGCHISELRRSAAEKLRSGVETCLSKLAMGSSRFNVRMSWEKV